MGLEYILITPSLTSNILLKEISDYTVYNGKTQFNNQKLSILLSSLCHVKKEQLFQNNECVTCVCMHTRIHVHIHTQPQCHACIYIYTLSCHVKTGTAFPKCACMLSDTVHLLE